jgi:hypothetical protein
MQHNCTNVNWFSIFLNLNAMNLLNNNRVISMNYASMTPAQRDAELLKMVKEGNLV